MHVTILPSHNTIKELINFTSPRTKKQLQSLLGVLNNLMKWIPGLSNHTSSIRELNKGHAHFKWLPEHQVELEAIKKLAAKLIPVHPFKRGRRTIM